jgi:hypothetical protein
LAVAGFVVGLTLVTFVSIASRNHSPFDEIHDDEIHDVEREPLIREEDEADDETPFGTFRR